MAPRCPRYYEDGEPNDISVEVKAVVRFGKEGAPELLEAAEVPAKD